MTHKKEKLFSPNEDNNKKRKHQEDRSNANIVEFVNPTKNKKRKKDKACIGGKVNPDVGLKGKKIRFSIDGEVLPAKAVECGEKVPNEKKKVRKPRWSEERKVEERKRKSEEPPSEHVEAHRTKKKKKTTKKTFKATGDTTSSLSTSALQYLQNWQYARSSWKFSKLKQTWLLKHTFDLKKMPTSLFPLLVEYISTCQGGARMKTYEAAAKIIQKLEEKASAEESDHDEEKEITKCLEGEESEKDKEEIHQRARSIMQQLSDCT